jgi:hypothetical protein
MSYEQKYLKYKIKYLILKENNPINLEQSGGGDINDGRFESKRSKYNHNSNNDIKKLILKFNSVKRNTKNTNNTKSGSKRTTNDNLDRIYETTQKMLDEHLKNKSKNAEKKNKLTAKNKK